MSKKLFIKFLDVIPTAIGISLIAFLLIRLIPGDPVMLLLGERGSDPIVYEKMKVSLGLDLPWYEQYWSFITKAFSGDFGTSIISKNSVWEEFKTLFPATLELGIVALFFALTIGIPLGIVAAIKRNSFLDYLFMTGSLVGYSMPIFWWGLILIIVFSVNLGLTPVSGRISVLYDIEPLTGFMLIDSLQKEVIEEEGFSAFISALKHLILPSIAMGTIPLAVIARMTRSSLLEVLKEDYIRTAKSKGLSPFYVICKHALRNALVPITTVIGLMFGSIITGAILTETIFSWPGIGKWILDAVNGRDYPVIQGGVLFIGFIVVTINLTVDILYSIINPKMR
ncbi:MAG: dipeptide ABC transporter permease DppB [Halobacteriovoraceae bacterium]|nr:dipeptide ABC transporter permease DppB [Halobacteriovoraceae bacterium]